MLAVGPNIKIVIVGDESVGKTELINKYSNAQIPISRTSTVFQSIQSSVEVMGVKVPVEIWDTTGKKQYELMIKSIYENANIILLVFSVAHSDTYQSALQKWYKEVNVVNQKALKIFVGNKTDIRNNGVALSAVKDRDAKLKIQQELRCKYLQCSALTGQGVKHLFQYSVRNHMGYNEISQRQQRKVKGDQCCIVM